MSDLSLGETDYCYKKMIEETRLWRTIEIVLLAIAIIGILMGWWR